MKKLVRIGLWTAAVLAALALINFAPMITPKSPGMEAQTYHGITVWALPEEDSEAEAVARRITERSRAVMEALGTGTQNGIEVIMYPDRKVLHRKTIGLAGILLPDWFIGDNTKRYVLITSPAAPGPAHSRASIEKAAVHEYVHVLTDRRNTQLGYWLKEGFALYLAEQVPDPASIRRHRGITYAEFSAPNAMQFARVGGYTLAYTLIDYLERSYGWDRVVALTAPGAGYETVLGKSDREIFDEWRASLQRL
jgi:hypothetical protein